MSHREHAPGAAERGNDWLDGALAGWLLFIAINGGNLAWNSLRDGAAWSTSALNLAVPVLAVAAIFPLLRFLRAGWALAFLALGLMAAREGMMLSAAQGRWRATAAFLAVDLLGMAYLLWIIPEFWPRHADPEPVAAASRPAAPSAAGESAESAATAEASASMEPTPVMHALAAIHHRIVAAGSACAVTEVAVRAEAGRFGVTPAALRTEGLSLYRTFLAHFMADGALSADEERELICLERSLDLDDDGVWRLRAEAGLVGGMASAAPPLLAAPEPALPPARPALAAAASPDADADLVDTVPVDIDPVDSVDAINADAMDADAVDAPAVIDDVDGTPPIAAADDVASIARVMGREGDVPPTLFEVPVIHVEGPPLVGMMAAQRDPSAQADSTVSEPRIHSPGLDDRDLIADPSAHAEAVGSVDSTASAESVGSADSIASASAESVGSESTADPVESAESAASVESASAESPESASGVRSEALEDYEEHELRAALAWAGIGALPADAPRRTALERLRALHRTATEPLDACTTDVALDPGESCLAQRHVQVYVAAAGAAPPPPDLPGPVLPRRALVDGSLERDRDLSTLQRRGACRFVLTERRLLLVTPAGQRSELAVSRVRAVLPHRNGIEIRQQRGAPVFLAFADGVDDAAMRMDRAAADLRVRA